MKKRRVNCIASLHHESRTKAYMANGVFKVNCWEMRAELANASHSEFWVQGTLQAW